VGYERGLRVFQKRGGKAPFPKVMGPYDGTMGWDIGAGRTVSVASGEKFIIFHSFQIEKPNFNSAI